MGFMGYLRAAIDVAGLALLVAIYVNLRGLPARVRRMVDAAREQGSEDAATKCSGIVSTVAAEASGIAAGLHSLHEEYTDLVRAERGAAEVRARIAERRAMVAVARAASGDPEPPG